MSKKVNGRNWNTGRILSPRDFREAPKDPMLEQRKRRMQAQSTEDKSGTDSSRPEAPGHQEVAAAS